MIRMELSYLERLKISLLFSLERRLREDLTEIQKIMKSVDYRNVELLFSKSHNFRTRDTH